MQSSEVITSMDDVKFTTLGFRRLCSEDVGKESLLNFRARSVNSRASPSKQDCKFEDDESVS